LPTAALAKQLDVLADLPTAALAKQLDVLAYLPTAALAKQLDVLAYLPTAALAKQLAALIDPLYATADAALRHASSRSVAREPLSREQTRLIVGMFCYILAFLVVLQVVLDVANDTGITPSVFGILVTMTGWSGHAIAMRARTAGLWAFDQTWPTDDS
jgi:hypothetical protein